MKVIDVNFSRHERLLRIQDALESMGHAVRLIYSDNYYHTVPYYKKKLDRLGFHGEHRRYRQEKRDLLFSWVKEWNPDRVLFLNPPEHFLSPEELVSLRNTLHERGGLSVGWFVDKAIKRHYIPYYDGFDRLFTYERQEVDTLRQFYGTNAEYGFVGYNPAYESVPKSDVPPRETSFSSVRCTGTAGCRFSKRRLPRRSAGAGLCGYTAPGMSCRGLGIS